MSRRNALRDQVLSAAPWVVGAVFGGVALHLIAILALPTLAPSSFYNRVAARLPLGETASLPKPSASPSPAAASPAEAALNAFVNPFADPFAAVALCRFDLRDGPFRVRASSDGERLFAVSVRLADGAPFYSVTDRQAPKGQFNILLVTQAQADALGEAQENDKANDKANDQANALTNKAQEEQDAKNEDVKDDDAKSDEQADAQGAGKRQDAKEQDARVQDARAPDATVKAAGPADELRLIVPRTSGFVLFRVLSLGESDYAEAAARRATISCAPEQPTP